MFRAGFRTLRIMCGLEVLGVPVKKCLKVISRNSTYSKYEHYRAQFYPQSREPFFRHAFAWVAFLPQMGLYDTEIG